MTQKRFKGIAASGDGVGLSVKVNTGSVDVALQLDDNVTKVIKTYTEDANEVFKPCGIPFLITANGNATFTLGNAIGVADELLPPEDEFILEGNELKLLAFGDSFTANGDSPRDANGGYIISTRGYWGCAWLQSTQDFQMLDAQGITGNTTLQMFDRISAVTSSDADVALILAGTNDLNQGRTPEQTRDGMAALLDAIIASGKKVLVTPIAKRRAQDGLNDAIDITNNYYRDLVAARANDVVMAESSPEFDAACIVSDPAVTNDGLHPSSYGAWLIGQKTAAALDKYFKSNTLGRQNLSPNPEFNGDTGLVLDGATGVAPNDWRIYHANPANNGGEGVGGTLNGDGTWTIKTGANSSMTNGTAALVRTGNHAIADKNAEYAFSIKISASNLTKTTLFRVNMTTQDSSAGTAQFSVAVPAGPLTLNSVRFRTPYVNVKNSTYVTLLVRIDGDGSEPIEFTVSEPMLHLKQ